MKNIKNFFPGSNTPEGFYSYYDYLPYEVNKIYIIKGGPGTGKSTFMKRVSEKILEKNYDIEYHWCSSDNDSLDGIVCPQSNLAIIDGTAPHIVDPVYPGAVDEIIYLGDCWDTQKLEKNKDNIIEINKSISSYFHLAYDYLNSAEIFFSRWKSFHRKAVNIKKINDVIETLIKKLSSSPKHIYKNERHLFGSAVTPQGPISYYQNLSSNIDNCYIIKGNPGTGKSIILKNIAGYILRHNYSLLYLHDPLQPSNYNGLIIPDFNTAVLSDSPLFPLGFNRSQDTIINLDNYLNKHIIKDYEQEILKLNEIFKHMVKYSCSYLKKAKEQHDLLEEYYINAMDFELLEEKRQKFINNFV